MLVKILSFSDCFVFINFGGSKMKKLAVFIGFFAIMMFVGCGKSEKSDSDGDNIRNDSDSTETSDFDTEEPDSGDPQSGGDTGDPQPDGNTGDPQPDGDTGDPQSDGDTGDPQPDGDTGDSQPDDGYDPDAVPVEGEPFVFGKYEQDGKTSNGSEYIRWRVLEVTGNKALLISEKGLDVRSYDDDQQEDYVINWQSSKIRTWLNETFYDAAFGPAEKAKIQETPLSDVDTTDKIFILNEWEAIGYFNGSCDRIAYPTEFASGSGVYECKDEACGSGCNGASYGAASWLLRDEYITCIRVVNHHGDIINNAYYYLFHIRPVLWIKFAPDDAEEPDETPVADEDSDEIPDTDEDADEISDADGVGLLP